MNDNDKIIIPIGGDIEFYIRIRDEDDDPIDLTNVTEASVCFLKNDNSYLTVSLTPTVNGSVITKQTPFEIGKLLVSLDDADTSDLSTGLDKTLEIHLTISSKDRVLQFKRAYDVISSVCT